ncbi:MAG: twin-arginine translocase subunit TatC [Betaproteobacteria bacterium]|nr:MAG: twin-arginine translocase subunit TatC [Betaproteobacteria bacterium]
MSESDSFMSHLIELRDRLMRAILALLIVFGLLFYWARDIYTLLAAPLLAELPEGTQMIAVEVAAPFFVPVKVTMFAALIIALPYVLYQAWAFVAPGLYLHEKKLVLPLIATSTLLFLVGMAFAYFIVFPVVFHFITTFSPEGVAVMTDIQKYFDFVLTLFLAFGVAFETPIAVVILTRMGIVSIDKLKQARPYVVVGAFVIAAIFTPPDVVSQLLLAFPLWLLYEFGLMVSGWLGKSAEDEQPQSDSPPS